MEESDGPRSIFKVLADQRGQDVSIMSQSPSRRGLDDHCLSSIASFEWSARYSILRFSGILGIQGWSGFWTMIFRHC